MSLSEKWRNKTKHLIGNSTKLRLVKKTSISKHVKNLKCICSSSAVQVKRVILNHASTHYRPPYLHPQVAPIMGYTKPCSHPLPTTPIHSHPPSHTPIHFHPLRPPVPLTPTHLQSTPIYFHSFLIHPSHFQPTPTHSHSFLVHSYSF